MPDDSSNDMREIDARIAYHQEMEYMAINGGNFAQAKHHRNMQEIYRKIKEHLSREPSANS